MRLSHAVVAAFAIMLVAAPHTLFAQDAQSRLWDAAMAGDTAAIRKAASEGAKLDSLDTRTNPNGRFALNWAAARNHADAVKLLLELKAPIDAQNLTGFTALNHAAENGSLEVARLLLAAGADPDRANAHGMTPLMVASERGHEAVAKLLEAAPRKKK